MKIKKLITAAFALAFFAKGEIAMSQIIVSNTAYTTPSAAQGLVNNILLGTGVTASNITFTPAGGESIQLGFFNGVNSNIGLDSGIVMSTGDILDIVPGSFSGNIPLGGSDPDLLTLANSVPPLIGQTFTVGSTNHSAILEFDFVPAADTVKFRYVFGSDEYTTYINTQYNDVFGFFISGPGINGPYANNAENIAVVPGTSPALPITISSVQPNLNGQYYISNTGQSTVALNGFTSVFTAVSPVICGETYHIRLAIADGSDGSLDSGVFLEALSFTSNAVSVVSNTVSGDSTIVEGCSQAAFNFFRPGSLTDTLIVPVNLSGTATEGVDYNFLPDSIMFLPGQNLVTVPVIPIADGIAESAESIIISFTQDVCGSIVLTTSLWIVPVSPIITAPSDTSLICPNSSITITADFSGGYPPYTVVWSTGDTANSITVNPGTTTTTYYYTVTDTCYGQPVSDSITVVVPPNTPLSVTASDDCVPLGGTGTLSAVGSGGFPPYSYAWILGGTFVGFSQTLNITGIQDTVYIVQINDGCGSTLSTDSVFVTIGNPVNLNIITLGANNSIVEGCGNGIFEFNRPGSTSDTLYLPISIGGSAIAGSDYNSINDTIVFLPGESQIQVLVSAINDGLVEVDESIIVSYNQIGCGSSGAITDSIMIYPLAPINPNAQTTYSITCPGDNVTINSSFTGGYPPYIVVWNTGDTASSITVSPAATTTYTYTVTDSCNSQSASQTITVNVPSASPLSAVATANPIVCPGQTSDVSVVASGGFPGYTYSWTLNGNPIGTSPTFTTGQLTQTTTYVLTVNDACGTTPLQQNVVVDVVPYTPITLDLGADITVPCPGTGTNLVPTYSNGARPYTFVWSAGAIPVLVDSAAIAEPTSTTMYYLTMTDACQQAPVVDSITVSVATYSALTAVASPDTTVCPGNPVTISVIADGGAGSYTYLWEDLATLVAFPNNNVVSISPIIDNSVTYRITVTDLCGNTAFDEVEIPLREDCDVVVPNIITPNGDGENQFLVFENLELFPQPKLEVFNRWGTKVFESDNYQNNWSPADLNQGVYYFTLELGTIEPKKGFFQLLK